MTKDNTAIIYPTIADYQRIIEILREFREQFSEDIPAFETRYTDRLESILAQIKANYFGQELYEGVLEKSVMLFYMLIKNHPFFNGNKRTAILGLYEFLSNNVAELFISNESIFNDEIYEMAVKTAESNQADIEEIKSYLRKKIDSFIIEY